MKGTHVTTKIIKKYGWEYHLTEVIRPEGLGTPQPCFMGFPNMALVSCNKIAAQPPKTKKS
jgi:hypothetical protein